MSQCWLNGPVTILALSLCPEAPSQAHQQQDATGPMTAHPNHLEEHAFLLQTLKSRLIDEQMSTSECTAIRALNLTGYFSSHL